jgi:hypothetical protein
LRALLKIACANLVTPDFQPVINAGLNDAMRGELALKGISGKRLP